MQLITTELVILFFSVSLWGVYQPLLVTWKVKPARSLFYFVWSVYPQSFWIFIILLYWLAYFTLIVHLLIWSQETGMRKGHHYIFCIFHAVPFGCDLCPQQVNLFFENNIWMWLVWFGSSWPLLKFFQDNYFAILLAMFYLWGIFCIYSLVYYILRLDNLILYNLLVWHPIISWFFLPPRSVSFIVFSNLYCLLDVVYDYTLCYFRPVSIDKLCTGWFLV